MGRMITMLKYDEYKTEIINRIQDYVPDKFKNYTVELTKVNKVNESFDALCFIDKNKSVNTSPVVYIDILYSYYADCKNIELVLRNAANIITEGFNMVNKIYVPNNIKDNVVLILINADANNELLKTVPHRKFLDLAFVYRWIINKDVNGLAGAIVNNDLVTHFNLNTDELFELAKANTRRLLPPKVETLKESMLRMGAPKELFENTPEYPIFVLSNKSGIEGAASIVFDDVLIEIKSKIKENFYILPSSINEVIIVPESFAKPDFIRRMVKDVNNTIVDKAERLSDSIYFYDRYISTI